MKKLLIIVGILVVVFFLVGFLLPSEYSTYRSIEVNAPKEIVFNQVNNLQNWPKWSPWQAADPSMKVTFGAKTEGAGASYSWTSEEMGNGSLEVEVSNPYQDIRNKLDFQQQGLAYGVWSFEDASNGSVKVTWGIEGEATGPIDRYFVLMMDAMVGPMFEQGLQKLKEVAEAEPLPQPEAAAEEEMVTE